MAAFCPRYEVPWKPRPAVVPSSGRRVADRHRRVACATHLGARKASSPWVPETGVRSRRAYLENKSHAQSDHAVIAGAGRHHKTAIGEDA
jgi:hypothetical protein